MNGAPMPAINPRGWAWQLETTQLTSLCGCKGPYTPTQGCDCRTRTNLLALFSHSYLSWKVPKKVKYH